MIRRRFLVPLAALLALAVAVPVFFGGGSHAQSEAGVVAFENPTPSASAELRVWQSVRDPLGGIWLSARPDADSSWTTSRLHLAMIEGGGWRVANHTVDAPGGEIEVRLWQDPGALRLLYLSARPHGASWNEYGTQRIRLDERSRSGRYRYGDVSVALEWPDAEPPPPGTARDALCIPEDLWRAGAELRLWRSVATPHRYYLSARPDTDSRWDTRRLTLEESDVEGWNTATATALAGLIVEEAEEDAAGAGGDEDRADGEEGADAGDAPAPAFELRLWQRGNALALSARVAGTTWDEYGTQSVSLNRRSASGNFTYANRVITLTLPESEPPLPGATRTWDCPETTPGGGGGTTPGTGAGTGEAEATPTPTPDPDNRAPWADAGDDQTVAVGDTVTLDGSGSADPDEDDITHAWTQTGGSYTGAVALTGENTASPTFTVDAALNGQTVEFTLTVTDEHGLSRTDTVTITVRTQQTSPPPGGGPPGNIIQPNQAPTADAGDDITAALGGSILLNGSGSDDPDGDNDQLTYTWTQDTTTTDTDYYTTEISLTTSGARAIFTTPTGAMGKKIKFTLTVTDPGGLTDTDEVIVTVTNNQAPTADISSPTANATFTPEAPVELTGSGSDPEDGTNVRYQWFAFWNKGGDNSTQITVTNPSLQSTTLTVPTGALAGHTIRIVFAVADNQNPPAQGNDTVTINVAAKLTTSNVTATTATLTIAGYKAAWWHKSASTNCTSVAANTASANVTGLTPSTSYTFKAYSETGCADANELATAPPFTTPVQLTADPVAPTRATLNLTGHTANAEWWYKSATTGHDTCTSAGTETSATVTQLTPSTSYTFTAYSATNCADDDLLATVTFKTGVSLEASNVTARGATLTIGGHTAQWWYKESADTTCEGRVAANTATKALTELTPGTTYTYSAYSAFRCEDANKIATARGFTTMAELTAGKPTATTVPLTITGRHTGTWYHKSSSTSGWNCSTAQMTNTATATGLSPGTAYTFTAYSDSNCANELDAASLSVSTLAPALAAVKSTTAPKYAATLTLDNWKAADGRWWYKSATTSCTEVAAGTSEVAVTGLTPGTSYTFTAYSDSNCAFALAAASSFTTTANLLPTIGPVSGKPANVTTGNSYTLTATGNDPDGSDLTYNWSVSKSPVTAPTATVSNMVPNMGVVTIPANAAIDDVYEVTVSVTDGDGGESAASSVVRLTVNNRPPHASAGGNACGNTGQRVSAIGLASADPDNAGLYPDNKDYQTLSYSWAQTGGAYTGAITFTGGTAHPSTYFTMPSDVTNGQTIILTLTVSDPKDGVDTDTLTVTAGCTAPANRAPTASAGSDQTVTMDSPKITVDGSGSSDPDGDTLTYWWNWRHGNTGMPVLYTSLNSPSAYFYLTSSFPLNQNVELKLTVQDGRGGVNSDYVAIRRENASPKADVTTANQLVRTGTATSFTLAVNASDSDGQTLTYLWSAYHDDTDTAKPDGLSFCPATIGNPQPNPNPAYPCKTSSSASPTLYVASTAASGTYRVGVNVSDGTVEAIDRMVLVVNSPPVVNSIGVNGRNLDGNATDPDGDDTKLVHTWSARAGSGITFSTNNTTSDKTTISGGTSGQSYTITLTVTDPHGATGEGTVQVTIQ